MLNKLRLNVSKVCDYGFHNPANFLKLTGALGWGLSCFAQLGAIIINDNIPAKEKKFLLAQELLDGVINVALFLRLTSKGKDYGEKHVEHALILPEKWKDFVNKPNELIKKISNNPSELKSFNDFKAGVGTITSLIGSAISCNIVTPIMRNILASGFQALTRNDKKANQVAPKNNLQSDRPIYNNPFRTPIQKPVKFSGYNYTGMKI